MKIRAYIRKFNPQTKASCPPGWLIYDGERELNDLEVRAITCELAKNNSCVLKSMGWALTFTPPLKYMLVEPEFDLHYILRGWVEEHVAEAAMYIIDESWNENSAPILYKLTEVEM